MPVQMTEPLPIATNLSPITFVKTRSLELFIVPGREKGNIGYEVNLLLMTDAGPLAGMIILDAQDKPNDWVIWSYIFRKILDDKTPHDTIWLAHQLRGHSSHQQLVYSALQRLTDRTSIFNCLETRKLLMERATNYISLF